MTTTLLSLRSKLQTAIGDKNQVYADNYSDAITNAIEQIYPDLFRYLDNRDLITGNILPPFNWSTTALLDIYTEGAGTTLKNTDGAYIWRGSSSLKATASGADDYWYISSNDYPRLLDLMDKTIDFKCWVYPEVANDVWIQIYTVKADGTTKQYLPQDYADEQSTAGFSYATIAPTAPAGAFTLLEAEDQSINDDIVEIQFRMGVHSTTKYAYFDQPRATGRDIHEYLLPTDAKKGVISRVYIQPSGYSDDICDDLHPKFPDSSEVFNSKVFSDGTYKYLYLPTSTSKRQIRLFGYYPLETLSVDTDTITPDGKEIDLLIAYAAHLMFEMECGSIAGDIAVKTADITTVDGEIATEDTAITAIATDIASVVSQIDTELSAVSTVASEDISRYDAKIGRLDGKKKRLEDKRGALQDKRDRLIEEKTALDGDIRRLDNNKARMKNESYEWLAKYRMLLPILKMITPRMSINLRT